MLKYGAKSHCNCEWLPPTSRAIIFICQDRVSERQYRNSIVRIVCDVRMNPASSLVGAYNLTALHFTVRVVRARRLASFPT